MDCANKNVLENTEVSESTPGTLKEPDIGVFQVKLIGDSPLIVSRIDGGHWPMHGYWGYTCERVWIPRAY